jgi:hypothetical protein
MFCDAQTETTVQVGVEGGDNGRLQFLSRMCIDRESVPPTGPHRPRPVGSSDPRLVVFGGYDGSALARRFPAQTWRIHSRFPFGSFLALPSNVVHAGVYGNPGNIRFHMIVRMRNLLWLEDGLLDRDCYNGEEVYEQRPPWSPAFDRLGVETKGFSDSFVVMLEQKFGGFFEREWVENNLKLK